MGHGDIQQTREREESRATSGQRMTTANAHATLTCTQARVFRNARGSSLFDGGHANKSLATWGMPTPEQHTFRAFDRPLLINSSR